MLDSNILSFMDVVIKENQKYDEIYDIEQVSPYPKETTYGDLMTRIEKHETERIFLNPSLDTVVSLQHSSPITIPPTVDDCSYDITRISPVITSDLISLSQRNGVDTVFLGKLPTQTNPILMSFGQIYGIFESVVLPSIAFVVVLSFVASVISSTFTAIQGVRSSKSNISRGGGSGSSSSGGGFFPWIGDSLSGMSDMSSDDLKTRLQSNNISLASFAGSPEIMEECEEVVTYLKNATKYEQAGAVLPRGILLEGPPGTGKTLLAKAIASECEASFLAVSASEFVEMFVGVGAQKIRELFSVARENSPCIIFIDEIDTIGKVRGSSTMPGNEEREQTLNQLLSEMDGFSDNTNILVMAATNRRDVLDKALLRPGRFDRIIRVPPPDLPSRLKILNVHIQNKQLNKDIDLGYLAEITEGFSGAQLKNLLNEAAIHAVRNGRTELFLQDIMYSLDKQTVGIIRKTDTRYPETKTRVAVHEAGHALMAIYYSNVFELQKISIQSTYNGAGGFTLFRERRNVTDGGMYTKNVLAKRLVVMMGGKAAESVYYGEGEVSLGATQDLQVANDLARKMITQFGFGSGELETYFERDMTSEWSGRGSVSEWTKEVIDVQVRALVYSSYVKAKNILMEHTSELQLLTDRLLAETVVGGPIVHP